MRAQPALTAADRLDLVVRGMHDIQTAAPEGFAIGVATPMDPIAPTPLHVAATTVAAGAVAAAATMPAGAIVGVGAGFAVAMLAAASAITGSGVLGDLARLAVAGLAAVLATFVARPAPSLPRMTVEYLKVVAMLLIGGLTVAGLAFDRSFMAGTQPFWGVKALLLGPAAIAMIVAAYLSLGRPRLADALPTINLPVRIWHLIALAVGIVAVGFMVLRSGNSMIEIDVELVLREQLEDLFVVRPRTKEFLIGFPALVAGILVAWRSRHGWWLYAVAAIGTASAINTFTHFHSPLLISIARTLIGLGLGYLVGLVLLAAVVAAGRALRRLSLLEAR